MANRIHHIHLIAEDIKKTAGFYMDEFGAEVMINEMEYGGASLISLKIGEVELRIRSKRPTDEGEEGERLPVFGLNHFGIQVDDIEATAAKLKGKGVVFTKEPGAGLLGSTTAFIKAPDNVLIELVEEPS